MDTKSIVTFAVGNIYQKYAINLAYTFYLNNLNNDINLYIISDTKTNIPTILNKRVINIIDSGLIQNEDILINKLFPTKYVLSDEYLIIDCDCLIFGDLTPIFYKLRHHDISFWGEKLNFNDIWFVRIDQILKTNDITQLHRINGSLYYFKNNEKVHAFFKLCSEIALNYDKCMLPRIHQSLKNDEFIASIAANKLKIPILPIDDNIKAETIVYPRRYINVLTKKAKLYLKNFETHESSLLHMKNAYPIIVCFDRFSINSFDYKINSYILPYFIRVNKIYKLLILCVVFILLRVSYLFKFIKWNIHSYLKTR